MGSDDEPGELFCGFVEDNPLLNVVGRIMPAGWYQQERLNYCRSFNAQMNGVVDVAAERVFPGRIASNYSKLPRRSLGQSSLVTLNFILHHQIIAAHFMPFLSSDVSKAAAAQTAANQAAIACALERYRLANGQFPETLGALTPPFISRLPNDVITGQPYKYRRAEDGHFILYSVGWNEKDDGGVPGKHGLFDKEEGDWVWECPAN